MCLCACACVLVPVCLCACGRVCVAHLVVYGSYEAHMGLRAKEEGQCRQWGEDWEWQISGMLMLLTLR